MPTTRHWWGMAGGRLKVYGTIRGWRPPNTGYLPLHHTLHSAMHAAGVLKWDIPLAELHRDRPPTEAQGLVYRQPSDDPMGTVMWGKHRNDVALSSTYSANPYHLGPCWALERARGKCGRVVALRELEHQETVPPSLKSSSNPEEEFSERISAWHSDLFDQKEGRREENWWKKNHTLTRVCTLP